MARPVQSLLTLALLCMPIGCATSWQDPAGEVERIREIERQRLRSLVKPDITLAEGLHAADFQLINPAGAALTKEQYLGSLRSGQLDYVAWEAGDIVVRRYGRVAVIRYQDVRFEVARDGKVVHSGPMYHTNVYEARNGQWQIVWSHASGVITPP